MRAFVLFSRRNGGSVKRYVSAVTAVVLFIAPGAGATAASIVAAATPAPVKCAIPKPCALFTNTSSGPALHGSGASGSGLEGASSSADGMYGTSAAGAFPAAGVEGESTNLTGSDVAGMFGATYLTAGTAPGYGVVGYGSSYGVVGVDQSQRLRVLRGDQ
jgi:hypothetical protein